jgi:hypothetical protein
MGVERNNKKLWTEESSKTNNLSRKHGAGSRARDDEIIPQSSGYYRTETTFSLEELDAAKGSRKYERYKRIWQKNEGKYASSTRAKNNRIYCLRYIELISSRLGLNQRRTTEAKNRYRRLNGDDFGSIKMEEYIHGIFNHLIQEKIQELADDNVLSPDEAMNYRLELRNVLRGFQDTLRTNRRIPEVAQRVEQNI